MAVGASRVSITFCSDNANAGQESVARPGPGRGPQEAPASGPGHDQQAKGRI